MEWRSCPAASSRGWNYNPASREQALNADLAVKEQTMRQGALSAAVSVLGYQRINELAQIESARRLKVV